MAMTWQAIVNGSRNAIQALDLLGDHTNLNSFFAAVVLGNVSSRVYLVSHETWVNANAVDGDADIQRAKQMGIMVLVGFCSEAKKLARIQRMVNGLPTTNPLEQATVDMCNEIMNNHMEANAQATRFFVLGGKEFSPGTLVKAYADRALFLSCARFGDARGELIPLTPNTVRDKNNTCVSGNISGITGYNDANSLQTFRALEFTEAGQMNWDPDMQMNVKYFTAYFWDKIVTRATLLEVNEYDRNIAQDSYILIPLPATERAAPLANLPALDPGPGPYTMAEFAEYAAWLYKFFNNTNATCAGTQHSGQHVI